MQFTLPAPVYLHAEQAIAAAEAGKHVLCEKPMALNVDECDRMIAACRESKVKLGIAYYRRFYPAIARIKKLIADGEIGEVSVAQINAFEYVYLDVDDPRHWFVEKKKSGGGPMMDFGCHRIEVLTNLFGKVRSVRSMISNDLFRREVEDTAIASLQFENGTCAAVTVTHAAREPQDTLHIFGTKGSIHVPVLNEGQMSISIGGNIRNESLPPASNLHAPLISDFADAVIHDREPEVSGEDGRTVQSVIEEIYR
jgi:predicted dehydrogenase